MTTAKPINSFLRKLYLPHKYLPVAQYPDLTYEQIRHYYFSISKQNFLAFSLLTDRNPHAYRPKPCFFPLTALITVSAFSDGELPVVLLLNLITEKRNPCPRAGEYHVMFASVLFTARL
ncbi:MAG: hypothetical protein MJ142_04825 [Clostridia bacterium]|nr:hypothetical protein [Clostridia bacterium]